MDTKRLPEFWTPRTCTYPAPFLLKIFIPVVSFFIFCIAGCTDTSEQPITKLYELNGQALGTTWTVKVLAKNELDEKELKIDVVRRLEELKAKNTTIKRSPTGASFKILSNPLGTCIGFFLSFLIHC